VNKVNTSLLFLFHSKTYIMLKIFRYMLIINLSTTVVSKGQVSPLLTRGPENGHLVIAGGNLRDTSVFNLFIRLAGGPEASFVIIPTAADDGFFEGDSALIMLERRFNRLGLQNITILHTRDPREADEIAFAEPITKARGVWFPGGRQWRLADSYLNTLTHRELNNLLSRGGVIGGSSAGATIQGSFLARGDTRANTIMAGDHLQGLSFIENVAIDQHLLARNRHFDMFEILELYPDLLGIGLDENTAIHVTGDTFEVIGKSYVAIYDRSRWSAERDTTYRMPADSKEFYFLKRGQRYDMRTRTVIR
jgi:cyanophycinase